MKKILEIIIFVVLIITLLIVGIQRFSNGQMSLFGFRIFRVISLSMKPEYNINDILLVKECKPEEIKKGDNIAYKGEIDKKEVVITHKVMDIEKSEEGNLLFHTRGIANNVEDPIVRSSQIYGVVVSKMYIFSIVNKIINNMYGFIILVFIPLIVLIIKNWKELISMIKESTDEK